MEVVLEDEIGSSISGRFQGVPKMICGTMQECGLTFLVVCIDVQTMI